MGVNRFFGVDPDADDLRGFMMGDWNGAAGRRRKPKKDYGEPPTLYEVELEGAEDLDGESGLSWSEKQASRQYRASPVLRLTFRPAYSRWA
jgi:hypothetical protein